MKLFLIRHGETVDNVAGLYAGTRDSALTNHGFEQAKRLGGYLADNSVELTHIFASPLSRAFRTAEAVRDAQAPLRTSRGLAMIDIVKVQELIERNYGDYEGRPYSTRSEWMKTGSDGHEGASGSVESTQSLARRGDTFLDQHLLPLFAEDVRDGEYTVAVVAHGMLLSHLWRRLLLRLPRKSLTIDDEIIAKKPNIALEHLGGWSNTGYLELTIRKAEPLEQEAPHSSVRETSEPAKPATLPTAVPPLVQNEVVGVSVGQANPSEPKAPSGASLRELTGFTTRILAIDSKAHLAGLKRQPGGIGSLANDQGQKKLDTFFKRQKLT